MSFGKLSQFTKFSELSKGKIATEVFEKNMPVPFLWYKQLETSVFFSIHESKYQIWMLWQRLLPISLVYPAERWSTLGDLILLRNVVCCRGVYHKNVIHFAVHEWLFLRYTNQIKRADILSGALELYEIIKWMIKWVPLRIATESFRKFPVT